MVKPQLKLAKPKIKVSNMGTPSKHFDDTLASILSCTLCKDQLPHGVRPVVQIHPEARILIAGQAPGRVVHESGVPFDDLSGDRLRQWLGLTCFIRQRQIAMIDLIKRICRVGLTMAKAHLACLRWKGTA